MTAPSRTDPRVFPSETGWLLALLAVAVLANAWFVASVVLPPSTAGSWTQFVMLLAPGPAMYYYATRLRVRRTRPVTGTRFSEAARRVRELAERAGITDRLEVRLGTGARAFVAGMPDRPVLVLGPELLALYDIGRRPVFEAVVRHELAHLRGSDLRWYQFATALRFTNAYTACWLVFVLALALAVEQGTASELVITAVRCAAMVLVAELVARVFLRVREHHADLHAADAGRAALLAALGPDPTASPRAAVRAWLRRHPGAGRRAAALVEPGVLLASAPGQVLLGALLGGSLLVVGQQVALGSTVPPALVGVLVGVPLTLFVTLAVWRAVWHAMLTGTRWVVPALSCGAALFAGLVLGGVLSPYSRLAGSGLAGIPPAPGPLLATAVLAVGLCCWLAAVVAPRTHADPTAARSGGVLTAAGLAALYVGGWAFAVLWTWCARLLGARVACSGDAHQAEPLCASGDPAAFVTREVLREYAATPYSLAAVAVLAGALLLARRRPVPAAAALVSAVLAAAVLVVTDRAVPPPPPVRLEFRAVLDATPASQLPCPPAGRPSSAPSASAASSAARLPVPSPVPSSVPSSGLPVVPPGAVPAGGLVACAADGSERLVLGPVELDNDDVRAAEFEFSGSTGDPQLVVTFSDPAAWESLTTRQTGARVAILLDDAVVVAPQIIEPLRDGTAVITGLTPDEARDLADRITPG
ncbi:MAG TPA: M48 family metalloprotease [Pseudonocardiaceae bacterium]